MVVYATVCFILSDGKVLLLKKSAELFGGGKWNGLGGRINLGESPEQACIREVFEESGLKVSQLKYHGLLKFWFGNKNELDWVVHVFSTDLFEGKLRESVEGALRWTELDRIPYQEMWEDNKYWLPQILLGKTFVGEFRFNEEGTRLLDHKITVKNRLM